MRLSIRIDGNWVTLSQVDWVGINKKRFDTLRDTPAGETVITQIMVNHKLGLMDANEALDKLFSE